VAFHDPFVPALPRLRDYPELLGRQGWAWNPEELPGFHAALIVTDHDGVDYATLAARCPLVVDTRNACERHGVPLANVVKA
jgi:UDP-N-acetyl-D-glucosamine dehydrogenase